MVVVIIVGIFIRGRGVVVVVLLFWDDLDFVVVGGVCWIKNFWNLMLC